MGVTEIQQAGGGGGGGSSSWWPSGISLGESIGVYRSLVRARAQL